MQTLIKVTAEDTNYVAEYVVNFRYVNNDSTISAILIEGEMLEDFAAQTFTYTHVYPIGHTELPNYKIILSDTNATYTVEPIEAFPGSMLVHVTAENGTSISTYEIAFSVSLNYDASLTAIMVDGKAISDFDTYLTSFDVELAKNYEGMPSVTATATDILGAKVEIENATTIPGKATITVTAENGTKKQYFINFTYGDFTLGISDISATSFAVYPTITDQDITIELGGNGATVEVYDITGNLLQKNKYAAEEVNISLGRKGLYLIYIHNPSEATMVKVIKE